MIAIRPPPLYCTFSCHLSHALSVYQWYIEHSLPFYVPIGRCALNTRTCRTLCRTHFAAVKVYIEHTLVAHFAAHTLSHTLGTLSHTLPHTLPHTRTLGRTLCRTFCRTLNDNFMTHVMPHFMLHFMLHFMTHFATYLQRKYPFCKADSPSLTPVRG